MAPQDRDDFPVEPAGILMIPKLVAGILTACSIGESEWNPVNHNETTILLNKVAAGVSISMYLVCTVRLATMHFGGNARWWFLFDWAIIIGTYFLYSFMAAHYEAVGRCKGMKSVGRMVRGSWVSGDQPCHMWIVAIVLEFVANTIFAFITVCYMRSHYKAWRSTRDVITAE